MASLLLAIIYIAFISLGLPDAILGSAWPSMYPEMQVPVSYAGIVSMIISLGTTSSSLMSDRVIRRFNTHAVTAFSVGLTTVALLGFSTAGAYWQLCLWAVPYGLGAGSVDAALNNYIALHYESRHMNWLHCFWGIGAMLGPYIMGAYLTNHLRWNNGYLTIGILQAVLAAGLLLSRPLWKVSNTVRAEEGVQQTGMTLRQTLGLPGAKAIFIAFFCYCTVEVTTSLWASSYFVLNRNVSEDTAASWASLFFVGITLGRMLSGFVSDRAGDRNMVRLGQGIILVGILCVVLPLRVYVALAGFFIIGLGCAPVYPCMLHETPVRFGADKSQAVMGMQMATAYVGSMFMPSVFGMLSEWTGISALPYYLLLFTVLMFVTVEFSNRRAGRK